MNSLPILIDKNPNQIYQEQSAEQFVERTANRIQFWVTKLDQKGALKEQRWILFAVLSNGSVVNIRRIGAAGYALVFLEGETNDGAPCLLLAHPHAIQLQATLVPRSTNDPPKREIGFHTGSQDINVQQ